MNLLKNIPLLITFLMTFTLPCISQTSGIVHRIGPSYTDSVIITKIVIDGNRRTKDRIIHLFMNIDTGDVYDSVKIKTAEESLDASGLFHEAKIHSIINGEKATLLVVVKEQQYFTISDFGGVIYDRRYGEKTDRIWVRGYGTLAFNNFRGSNEQLNVSISLFRFRYIGLSWYKPFIHKPYYIKLGSTIGGYPSIVTPWHAHFFNSSFLSVGRKIKQTSKIYSTLLGRYMDYIWKGGNGELYKNGDTQIKSLPSDSIFPPFERDTEWEIITSDEISPIIDAVTKDTIGFDTTLATYSWTGFSDRKIKKYEKPFTELYLSLGWSTDKRDKRFNAHKGFYFSLNAKTNALYPYKDFNLKKSELRYLQLAGDFKFYHRGIWESNSVGYRTRMLTRLFGKGNVYSGIYMGNEYSLRGYGSGAFGGYKYNHRFLFSWEYRFPIYKFPELSFPWLAWYDNSLNKFQVRIDGAFIVDCGYLWQDLTDFRHPQDENRGAGGLGFGLRFMFPSLRRGVCADLVFPVAFPDGYFGEDYGPAFYLYLDLPF